MRRIFIPILVLILILGSGVFFLQNHIQVALNKGVGDSSSQKCARNPEPGEFGAAPYYTGPLFETHLHIPSVLTPPKMMRDKLELEIDGEYAVLGEEVTIEKIICLLDKENIIRAVAFFPVVTFPFMQKPFIEIARRTVQLHTGRIIPFIMPVPFLTPTTQPDTLKRIFDENKGIFKGYGEI